MTHPDDSRSDLLYGLDDRPPWIRLGLYGLQWLLVIMPTLTVLTVVSSEVLGLSPAQSAGFFQRLLIVSGGAIIVQTLWGHQLPLMDGPAAALLITLASLASSGQQAINGGMIVGGIVVFACGALGLMRLVTPLFTDRVVGVILLLIGLTMLPYLMPMIQGVDPAHPHGRPLVFALGLALTLLVAVMTQYLTGLLKSLSILWGIIIGFICFAALGMVDISNLEQARWLRLPALDWGGPPKFEIGAVLSFLFAYLAVVVNAAGSIFTIQPMVRSDHINRRLNRGVAFTGLSGILSGLAGVIGTVPYSLSPGVITVTHVGSRFVLTMCGAMMIALAFFGKLAALLSAVPDAVVAASLLASIGAATGYSIQVIIGRDQAFGGREFMVVGLPILLGTGVTLLPDPFMEMLPATLRPLIDNGLIVGAVTVLLLEHLIMPAPKEKNE